MTMWTYCLTQFSPADWKQLQSESYWYTIVLLQEGGKYGKLVTFEAADLAKPHVPVVKAKATSLMSSLMISKWVTWRKNCNCPYCNITILKLLHNFPGHVLHRLILSPFSKGTARTTFRGSSTKLASLTLGIHPTRASLLRRPAFIA